LKAFQPGAQVIIPLFVSRRTRGGKPLFTWIKLVSGKQHFYEYLRKSKFKQNAAV